MRGEASPLAPAPHAGLPPPPSAGGPAPRNAPRPRRWKSPIPRGAFPAPGRCIPRPPLRNGRRYRQYAEEARKERGVLFLGRLGRYAYLDMDQAIEAALEAAEGEIGA
jgi:hypothetical protein